MKYNRNIQEIMRGDVTLEELKQYRNVLNQRRDYYRRWFKKRADGIAFGDTRHALDAHEVRIKAQAVDNELNIVNALVRVTRDKQLQEQSH